jgi:SAM-dependent methyltransferase
MNHTNAAPRLMFTGERVVPGKSPPFLLLEHLVRYRFAAHLSSGLKVLDVGCGTGYGTSILAEKAGQAVGIDSDQETIHYANRVYSRPNLRFTVADCRYLPFADGLFGLAVSFEVIEHIDEQDQCLDEIRRVLSRDGVLILSTPNASRSTKVIEEANPFHYRELAEDEFKELLGRHFDHVDLLYQHELSASSIQATAPERTEPVEIVEDFVSPPLAKYFIAVCGTRPAAVSRRRSLGIGGIEHQIAITQDVRQAQTEVAALLRQREENEREHARNLAVHRQEIDSLKKEIEALHRQREENEREHARNLAAHRQEIDSLKKEIEALHRQREEKECEYARNLEIIRHQGEQIAVLEEQCATQRIELEWLYRWIPVNRLVRRLLFGRNLRSRLRSIFHTPYKNLITL